MATWNTAEKNGMWRGGRVIASNGYVLIRVGKDHHLADCRGYAYEHRLVAEQSLGRKILSTEIVHHIDHNQQNNDPANLKVCASNKEHFAEHESELMSVIRELCCYSPYTRSQMAELFDEPPKKVGWALQRLRKKGQIRLLESGSWSSFGHSSKF